MYFQRLIESKIKQSLDNNPVTAILGPRQCGKSTLAKYLISLNEDSLYLDLERPSDLQKLEDAEWFLSSQKKKIICIDEIQRKPDIFPLLRSLVDEWGGTNHFLILGSASRDLLRQSSETLAGRIRYNYLTPFLQNEIYKDFSIEQHLTKGGFPRSILANDNKVSYEWREDFITTFLERDLLQWAGFSPAMMRKLWTMISHMNGQTLNYSMLGNSLGMSNTSIKNYIDLLTSTFMVVVLPPYIPNIRKRLTKTPKVYLNDTGLINTLLGIQNFEQISGHPSFGNIWEAYVLANIKGNFPSLNYFYYRTTQGAEIDFIIEYKGKVIAIECKATLSPSLMKGSYIAIEDVKPIKTLIVAPVKNGWQMKNNIEVVSVLEAISIIKKTLSV